MEYVIENNSDGLGPVVRVIEGSLSEQEKSEILRDHLSIGIKLDTEREILEVYPYYKQLNLQNEVIEILALANYEKRDFTDSELLKIQEAKTAKEFIDQKRAECNAKINSL